MSAVVQMLPVPPALSPELADALQRWQAVKDLLNQWFHQPDSEGLLCALCAACSHYYKGEKPVWLLTLGASGSGKTEIIVNAGMPLVGARVVGDITPAAFLSSFSKGGPKNTLLPPSGHSSIWLIKDFTTICSMRQEARKEVATRFREVWDGHFVRDTGVGPTQKWEGKVTCLAMGTPELDDHWGAMRTMGERFLYLRWRSATTVEDRRNVIQLARAQLGHVDTIKTLLQDATRSLCDPRKFGDADPPPHALMSALDETADLVALLRVTVERDIYVQGRPILGVATMELPTRIGAGLSQIARTHQAMFPGVPWTDSLRLAQRVAEDTVPLKRHRVLTLVPRDSSGILYSELLRVSEIPRTTLQRVLEDLTEMNVLDRNNGSSGGGKGDWGNTLAVYHPSFLSRLDRAQLFFHP